MIPERAFELRIVTALPVTLYTSGNRKKVKSHLERFYRFGFNGTQREALIKVGHVVPEGQGVLAHYGDTVSDQVVFDIGERTFDLIVSQGQEILFNRNRGMPFGVGQLVDDLVTFGNTRGVGLGQKAHGLLRVYADNQPIPNVKGIPGADITEVIAGSVKSAGRTLGHFIKQNLAGDGENTAAQFDRVFLAGGGAYYFAETIESFIDPSKIEIVENAEIANALGYTDIAVSLQNVKADIWESKSYGVESR